MSGLSRVSVSSRHCARAALHPGNASSQSRNFAVSASLQNVEKDTEELIAKVEYMRMIRFLPENMLSLAVSILITGCVTHILLFLPNDP